MNVKNYAKRALSLVLVLCMLVGIVPMGIIAAAADASALDYAIFCSDVHGDTEDLREVMSVIGTGTVEDTNVSGAGIKASSISLLGDTCATMANTEAAIATGLGYSDIAVNYVYASKHDTENGCDIGSDSRWTSSGVKFENEYYIVYSILESDIAYQYSYESTAPAEKAVAEFKSWAAQNDGTKPIFVVTHRPFHVRRGENRMAGLWFDAINEAAEKKDIVVLWGHNHYEEESADTDAYYVAKGEDLNVQYKSAPQLQTDINFTYMNAGYINANDVTKGNETVGRRYMASTVAIYEDELVFQDYHYNNGGKVNTSTIEYGKYTGDHEHNVTIKLDHAKKETAKETITLTDAATGVTVVGALNAEAGLTVSPVTSVAALNDVKLYTAYKAYDITFDTESTASVSIPVPADYPVGNVVVYYVNGNELTDMNAKVSGTGDSRVATFATDHNSTYAVVYAAEPAAGGGTATSIEQATSLEQGVPYIIVCDRSGAVLTGTASGNDLQLSGTASVETKDLWYYNGKNLIYGDPNSTDKYLLVSDGAASIGSKNGNKTVTNVFLNKDGKTFSIGTAERQYLNQYGGQSSAIAAGYRIDGNSDDGSKWRIYKLVGGSGTSGPSVDEDGGDTGFDIPAATVGDWVTITAPSGGTTTYTYTQATSIEAGKKYVIVANSNAVALMDNGGSMGNQTVTISGTTMTSTTALTEWTFSGQKSGTIYNGTHYLRYSSSYYGSSFNLSTSDSTLTFTDNGSNFRIYNNSSYGTDYSFYYNGSSWTRSDDTQYVRLYQLTGTTTTGATGGKYAYATGNNVTAKLGDTVETAEALVKENLNVYTSNKNDGTGTETPVTNYTLNWIDEFDGNTPGSYTVSVEYDGKSLGTVEVVVPYKTVSSYELSAEVGYVNQYADAAAVVKDAENQTITITTYYKDGTTAVANLTVGMIDGAQTTTPGRFDNLTVSYKNNPLTESFTLNVREKILSDYPDYPDEGAVKVNKTSTGHSFQDTGIAEVELSTSGVPMKKGVDVIIMLDTSSSMKNNSITENGVTKTREEILEDSLANLIAKFKQPAEDGEPHDIRVAIGDFNGYFRNTGTPYDVDSDDKVSQDNGNQNPNVEVFTSPTNALDETAFLHVSDLENSYNVTTTSGTNYDYAFDAIYQLGAAIQDDNKKKGEDRDLYVIFMSDGTPFQWNYYTSQRDTADWNKWLTGSYKTQAEVEAAIRTNGATYCTDHAYYYNLQDTNNDGAFNEHRMANAIKGNKESYFEVIRKTTAGISTERLQDTGTKTDNLYTVPGLGAKMFSIGFAISSENKIELSTVQHAIKVTASEQTGSTQYYYEAKNATELDHAFDVIGAEITYAAYNARYVDMMGERFNLQMSHTINTINVDGDPVKRVLDDYDITPAITVKTYTIWTRQEAEAGKCSYAQVGQRKDIAPTVLERVEFSADGKEAYSSLNGVDAKGNINNTVNIIKDGVICAKTFWYNTNTVGALVDFDGDGAMNDMLDADGGGVRDDLLPAETFYWKVGTVQAKELAISYFVYLAGSLEGEAQAGSYATNQSAILYYDNYLGHACKKEVASPVMAWKAASVKYAFYLVNDKGEVVVNQTTGETGTFANRIAVTQPVLHSEILLNNLTQVNSINVASDTVLPEGYTLYDPKVTYTIVILSGSDGGSWTVAKTAGKADATYVTGYKGSSYTNVAESSGNSYDYTNTTVWFAVLWQRQTVPDTVVVDFGLPVDIGVLVNDMFGQDGALAGIAPDGSKPANIANNGYTGGLSGVFGTSVETTIANVSINSDEVRYAPKTANGMNFATVEKFDYAVLYSGDYNAGYYYGDVTVIPASTIYYEENFVSFNNSTAATDKIGVWSDIGDADENATQDEDRAGLYNVHEIDANNVYGYDSAYRAYKTYSNGGAKIITVDSATGAKRTAPTATFTFTGTGFDIIALTDNDSGAITVTAVGANGATYRKSVNNYYGYSYVDGKWVVDTSSNDTIWQVPVLKFEGMAFDTYTVTISVAYTKSADMNYVEDGANNSYKFVLDAIRIYDPIDVNTQIGSTAFPTVEDVYIADKEADPDYVVIKDIILNPDNITSTGSINGAVFIDGLDSTSSPALYSNPGPNNETYLAYGQSVAFKLVANAEPKALQLGVKLAQGDSATVSLNNGAKTRNFTTASDMYYTLPIDWVKDDATGLYFANVSLANDTQGAIVSLTNLKLIGAEFTFSATPMPASEYSLRSSDIQVSIVCDPEFVETTTMDMLRAYSDDLNAAGDINGDGTVNAIDSNIMNRAVAGVVSLDMVQKIAADVDESNKINGIDSNLLVRKVAGKN